MCSHCIALFIYKASHTFLINLGDDDFCVSLSQINIFQVAAQGSEFICSPCPAGLDGDGQNCYDENECLTIKPCAQECENTAGSFVYVSQV